MPGVLCRFTVYLPVHPMSVPDSPETQDNRNPMVASPFDWWFELDEGWQASLLGLAIFAIVSGLEFIP